MKKLLTASLLILFSTGLFAQKMGTLEVVQAMMQMKTIVKYKSFKKDIEKQLKEVTADGKLKNKPEDYLRLQTSYINTQHKFDDFLGVIKADMIDYRTVKKMVSSPEKFAAKYMESYSAAVGVYEAEFIPAYMQAKAERAIPPEVIKLGIQGFVMLVGYLKKRSDDKKENFGSTVDGVNNIFFGPLRMKDWSKIVSYSASASSTNEVNNGGNSNNTEVNISNNTIANKKVHIAYPTVNEMHGSIEFIVKKSKNSGLEPMDFGSSAAMRDLSIGGASEVSIEAEKCPNCLNSGDAYSAGASFQIKTDNNAFMYVFAFNSNNTCYPIYPFSKEWVNAFKMSSTRDLVIGGAMLRDESGTTVIPSKNATTGEENFINISGNSTKETLCLIVSKSELNLDDIIQKIDAADGKLNERIDYVFGKENLISFREARVETRNGKISFDADYNSKHIMPFIFNIKRR